MTNTLHIETDSLYLVERTHDEDGNGWSFARLDVPAAMVSLYVTMRSLWDERTAHGYNDLIDIWDIPADHRVLFVNEGAFNRAVATLADVKEAGMALHAASVAITTHLTDNEAQTYGIRLDECDMVGETEFNARYMPLIRCADAINERAANDPHSHVNRMASHNYTSLFNGR